MRKLAKLLSPVVGVIMVATLLVSNGALVFATPAAPTQPAATECTDCQSIQDDLDTAYTELEALIADIAAYDIEGLLDQTTTVLYAGDPLLMVDYLTAQVADGYLLTGTDCEDSTNSFAYYSSFSYEDTLYCTSDAEMWYGVDPDYYNFLSNIITLTEPEDAALAASWQSVWEEVIELLMDYDEDDTDGVAEYLDWIDQLLADLADCEDTNCPEAVECPDCETIADNLDTALDELAALEVEADLLDFELTELETEIDGVFDQLEALETLRAEFEQMVEDAGGMHGEDCDGFEPASGQAWGIAHNFGDVQWCFTNEGQIEDMIQNLDEYWQTHSSEHLPSEAELNEQLDTLIEDYLLALTDYFDVLDQIDDKNAEIDQLAIDLEECLAELQALQDEGECLDQDIEAMQAILDEANGVEPFTPEPPEEPSDGPEDAEGHWAEEYIDELFNADVVSGDSETGLFRPDDEIKRGEASKIVTLAHADDTPACDSFFDVFTDVDMDDWFCPFVDAAQGLGYFNGYPDGTFGPELSILRGESAAVVLRVLDFDIPEYDTYSFPDVTGDEWYADEAEKAYQCGIFSGRQVEGEDLFAGGETITRAEFAKIVDVAIYNELAESDCADYVAPTE